VVVLDRAVLKLGLDFDFVIAGSWRPGEACGEWVESSPLAFSRIRDFMNSMVKLVLEQWQFGKAEIAIILEGRRLIWWRYRENVCARAGTSLGHIVVTKTHHSFSGCSEKSLDCELAASRVLEI
jgi:hypothetical protein